MALGWYLDGRVSALVGTHTHIPPADERILPGGTAFQTDEGITGPYDKGAAATLCLPAPARKTRGAESRLGSAATPPDADPDG